MFTDRDDAGRRLAAEVIKHPLIQAAYPSDLLVLSIPRGGVVIGAVVANVLDCPHDVLIVKKIGLPENEEVAIGAVVEEGSVFTSPKSVEYYGVSRGQLNQVIGQARAKVERYVRLFRGGRSLDLQGKTVIVVDDGIATGATIEVALHWLQAPERNLKYAILAVPVCANRIADRLECLADAVICVERHPELFAVSQFYNEFAQVSDQEVLAILQEREPRLS